MQSLVQRVFLSTRALVWMVAGPQTRYIFTFTLPRLHFAEQFFVQFENILQVPCKHKLHYQITAALKCE